MATTVQALASPATRSAERLPVLVAGFAFAVLFSRPALLLVRDWWTDPDGDFALLLARV